MAALPIPITVRVTLVPLLPESRVYLPASSMLVIHTHFLGWIPAPAVAGVPAEVYLPTWAAIRSFFSGVWLSSLPADVNFIALNNISLFMCQPNHAFWNMLFTEWYTSGIVAAMSAATDLPSLHSILVANRPANPANATLCASIHIHMPDPFDIPGGPAPAGRGRGRGRGAAGPPLAPTPGPPGLKFIDMATILMLAPDGERCETIARLAGWCGACFLHVDRLTVTSMLVTFATMLKANMSRFYAPLAMGGLSDALLAVHLHAFAQLQLPERLRAPSPQASSMLAEGRDTLTFRASASNQLTIEELRVYYLGPRCACFPCPSMWDL